MLPVHCAAELPHGWDHSSPASFQSYFVEWLGILLWQKRGWGRNRTGDTWIFSPLLCQLSYPAFANAPRLPASMSGLLIKAGKPAFVYLRRGRAPMLNVQPSTPNAWTHSLPLI